MLFIDYSWPLMRDHRAALLTISSALNRQLNSRQSAIRRLSVMLRSLILFLRDLKLERSNTDNGLLTTD